MKRVFIIAAVLLIAVSMSAVCCAETFEDMVFGYVDSINAMLSEYYDGVVSLYAAYEQEDEYTYIFYTEDSSVTLMITGEDGAMTGGAVYYNCDTASMNTASASYINFFAEQGLRDEVTEMAIWMDQRYDALIGAMQSGTQYNDGFVTSSDLADIVVFTSGNGIASYTFNYYPETRTAYYGED